MLERDRETDEDVIHGEKEQREKKDPNRGIVSGEEQRPVGQAKSFIHSTNCSCVSTMGRILLGTRNTA